MADQLVHDVGLRRVERPARVAHILGREKPGMREGAEEGAIADQPRHRPHGEPRRPHQRGVDVLELRHQLAVESEGAGCIAVLGARVLLVERRQTGPDGPPGLPFLCRVIHARHRPFLVLEGDARDRVPPLTVDAIPETWMIGIERDEVSLAPGMGRRGFLVDPFLDRGELHRAQDSSVSVRSAGEKPECAL